MKSWVEISRTRLASNLRSVQAVAGPGAETLAVIKADAYGHSAELCAPVLAAAGARWLGVGDAEEGARVRAALGGGSTRLLVMCGMEPPDAHAIVAHGLTPVVWTAEHVLAMEGAACAAGTRTAVHLEIDTGMGRQGAAGAGFGVNTPELAEVTARLAASRWIWCEGVMSHLCCAEIEGAGTTTAQQERFGAAVRELAAAGIQPEFMHLANTSAVDEGSGLAWVRETAGTLGATPMVRTGLAIYGYALPLAVGSPQEREHASHRGALAPRLKPVMEWKTRVIGLRELMRGASVGYGATFVADRPMRVALLPVGYADGFRRAASSGLGDGWVMIGGRRAPVVGRVSMNLTVVDVTTLPDVGEGTEVVLLGEGVTAEDHARWSGTIPYEILCGVRAARAALSPGADRRPRS